MNNTQVDWTCFTRTIHINRPVKEVFNAWQQSGVIEEWFLENASFTSADGRTRGAGENAQPGDTYCWKWYGSDYIGTGTVLESEEPYTVRFGFAGEGEVIVRVRAEEKGATVELQQSGIPIDEISRYTIYYGCSLGWSFWMVNLKAWLEHGITLNDKRPASEEATLGIHTRVNA